MESGSKFQPLKVIGINGLENVFVRFLANLTAKVSESLKILFCTNEANNRVLDYPGNSQKTSDTILFMHTHILKQIQKIKFIQSFYL